MIKINIFYNNKDRENVYRGSSSYIKKNITFLNKKFKKYQNRIIYFNLMLSGDNQIRKLNKMFRNKNKTTDVLSFPFYAKKELQMKLKKEREIFLGDIIVNLNKIKNKENKTNFRFELNKLWIHGLVHLFGHKHKKAGDYYKMNKIEKQFFSYLN